MAAQSPMPMPSPEPDAQSAVIEHLLSWHGEDLHESLSILLRGVPPEGGHVTRADLELVVREAFLCGIVCERMTPAP